MCTGETRYTNIDEMAVSACTGLAESSGYVVAIRFSLFCYLLFAKFPCNAQFPSGEGTATGRVNPVKVSVLKLPKIMVRKLVTSITSS